MSNDSPDPDFEPLLPGSYGDILANYRRDYFRMSEVGACALQIAHRILGTSERRRYDSFFALEMGKAMEPVVNKFLRNKGLTVAFDGSNQLEVAAQDPYRRGHPDGLVHLSDPRDLDPWMLRKLDADTVTRLIKGEVFLLEDKTMNNQTWQRFQAYGLANTAFTAGYIDQVNEYMGAWNDIANDELWPDTTSDRGRDDEIVEPYTVAGSNSFKRYLRDYNVNTRPHAAIVAGFNTANKQIAFETVEYDPALYARNSARLDKLSATLHAGDLPEPTYDGSHPDCYFCPFAYVCPAVQARFESPAFLEDDLPLMGITDPVELEHIDQLASQYVQASNDLKIAESKKEDIRNEILELVSVGDNVLAPSFSVKVGFVKGRTTVDMDKLKELAEELEIEIPYRTNEPSNRVYIKPLNKDKEAK